MEIAQLKWHEDQSWVHHDGSTSISNPDFILCFCSKRYVAESRPWDDLKALFPNTNIIYCTTSGEIAGSQVFEESLSATVVSFEHTDINLFSCNISDYDGCKEAGAQIVKALNRADLRHIFVLTDGQLINGTCLVKGMNAVKSEHTSITGGLAGDGTSFTETYVGLNSLSPKVGEIVAIGFYGHHLEIGFGSQGGWDAFGPERTVTRSERNVLHELDGQSALSLYKKYLGESVRELPSSALYFPLSMRFEGEESTKVRTILSIDEQNQSMTFAGDIPEGAIVRLMKHNQGRLIDGAEGAAQHTMLPFTQKSSSPELAILISCVGRKIVLGDQIDEEVEVVQDILGDQVILTGFYSYGELAPQTYDQQCELHNQTMTITTFKENIDALA